jgi:hypothetical protein
VEGARVLARLCAARGGGGKRGELLGGGAEWTEEAMGKREGPEGWLLGGGGVLLKGVTCVATETLPGGLDWRSLPRGLFSSLADYPFCPFVISGSDLIRRRMLCREGSLEKLSFFLI